MKKPSARNGLAFFVIFSQWGPLDPQTLLAIASVLDSSLEFDKAIILKTLRLES